MNHPSQCAVIARAREIGQSLATSFQHDAPSWDHADAITVLRSVSALLNDHLGRLAATDCWGEANRLPSSAFWDAAAEWLRLGSLQWHARTKPFGYAGDHVMLDRICRNDVAGCTIGRAMDQYFQSHAAPTAVRNRAQIVRDQILRLAERRAGEQVHVVSFGSGPAHDLELALQVLPPNQRQRFHWTLVDMDPRALEFATKRLLPLIGSAERLRPARLNLARFPMLVDRGLPFPPADLLSCPGFFDYLRHEDAVSLLQSFHRVVAPHATWIVFNFGDQNPSQTYMEWVGNWYLHYRNLDSLGRIAKDAGIGSFEVDVEPAGVNLFLRGWRASA